LAEWLRYNELLPRVLGLSLSLKKLFEQVGGGRGDNHLTSFNPLTIIVGVGDCLDYQKLTKCGATDIISAFCDNASGLYYKHILTIVSDDCK
jgi:hypothetical protein